MRKKKYKRLHGKMTIVYISMITSLSLMGVGYAAWNDGLKIEMNFTTGNLNPTFKLRETDLYLDDCDSLSMQVVGDNTLEIIGFIYPTFENDFPIVIGNQGTIPVKLSELNIENDGEISKIQDQSISRSNYSYMNSFSTSNSTKYINTLIEPEEEVEAVSLNIAPESEDLSSKNKLMSYSTKTKSIDSSGDDDGEIGRLRNRIRELRDEISILEDEIREYEKEEEFGFNYELLFEQDL